MAVYEGSENALETRIARHDGAIIGEERFRGLCRAMQGFHHVLTVDLRSLCPSRSLDLCLVRNFFEQVIKKGFV